MLLRLLAAAKVLRLRFRFNSVDTSTTHYFLRHEAPFLQVRTPGGPWLVAFEDFCNAARMEPALPLA